MKVIFPREKLLHQNQIKVFDNLARFTVISAGRRWGKTMLAVFIIVVKASFEQGIYWWVSPSYKVQTSAWRKIKIFISTTFRDKAKINESSRTIYLPNGSIIEFRSADKPQDLVSEGLSGLVMDECADIKEDAWTISLRPTLADNEGWAVFIGTPEKRNWFFHLYRQAERENNNIWRAFHFTSYDNPYVKDSEIELMKAQMSEREFRQEVLAEFISEGGQIYRKDWFNDRKTLDRILWTFISWDTASTLTGAYSSGVVAHVAYDYKVYIAEVFREKLEFPQLQYKVEELAKKYLKYLKGIVIENKSSGIQVVQSLEQTADEQIANLIFPFNPKGKKEERAYEAAKWCEKGMIYLPPPSEQNLWLPVFEDELFSFPDSEYKDQIDAFNQLILYLVELDILPQGYRN